MQGHHSARMRPPNLNCADNWSGYYQAARPNSGRFNSNYAARHPRPRVVRTLTEAIRSWIPEITLQSQPGKNLAHLVRLRPPRLLLQSGRIPSRRKHPELAYRYERPHRVIMSYAPITNQFFRPEEEHVGSREYDVVPPLRGRNKAMEKPGRRFGPVGAHCKTKRLSGLLAPGVNHA